LTYPGRHHPRPRDQPATATAAAAAAAAASRQRRGTRRGNQPVHVGDMIESEPQGFALLLFSLFPLHHVVVEDRDRSVDEVCFPFFFMFSSQADETVVVFYIKKSLNFIFVYIFVFFVF
jgi:hypothetical protein